MALVAEYGSDASDGSEDAGTERGILVNDRLTEGNDASTSSDSYFLGSDSESENSATRRRREAEERLTNSKEEVSGPNGLDLPPPLEVIGSTTTPDFLKPEATKPLAKPFHRSQVWLNQQQQAVLKTESKPKEWDIASMAPKLKRDASAPGQPGAAVITAAAKRYKPDTTEDQIVTAAQVAMLGGQWQPSAEQSEAGSEQVGTKKPKGGASKAMPVADFLAKGHGASLLPRSRQDRKEKEKEKRSKGQSSVHGWKSEAEMVLRQQYDS